MKITQWFLISGAIFLFLEVNIYAQGSYSFNSIHTVQDTTINIDSTRRAKNRQFWAEFWQDYAPAISVGGGVHTNMLSKKGQEAFSSGPAWNTVIDIPFDKGHYINWELAFHMLYGNDSLGQMNSTYGGYPVGMRFYFTERNSTFRPFVNSGISYIGWLFVHINIGGGVNYTLNSILSAQISIQKLYNYKKKTFSNGTFAVPYTSFVAFIGLRYQL